MSALDGIARANGAIGALQTAVGAIVAGAEAEDRALVAERRVMELERELHRVRREEYRRGYGTGYATARRGAPLDVDGALRDPRCKVTVAA